MFDGVLFPHQELEKLQDTLRRNGTVLVTGAPLDDVERLVQALAEEHGATTLTRLSAAHLIGIRDGAAPIVVRGGPWPKETLDGIARVLRDDGGDATVPSVGDVIDLVVHIRRRWSWEAPYAAVRSPAATRYLLGVCSCAYS